VPGSRNRVGQENRTPERLSGPIRLLSVKTRSWPVRWERFISNVDWDDAVGKSTLKDWNLLMKVTIKRAAVIASVLLGAAGGLIFADHPYWGSVLLLAGVVGAVYTYLSSERTQAENEDFFDATAKLMFGSGAGNPYTERITQRTTRPGHYQDIFADLDKALSIDPNDADALSLYCISAALHLCFRHLVSSSNG
jgi:hypothetical protein